MLDPEGEKTEEQTSTETEEVITPPVDRTKELETEIARVKAEADSYKKGLSSAHQRLSQKDTEIKRLQDFSSRLSDFEEKLKILAAAQASGAEVDEEEIGNMTPAKKQNLLKKFEELEQRQATKRQQAEVQAKQEAERERQVSLVDNYRLRVEALGFTSKDKEYRNIYRLVRTLDPIDMAEADEILGELEKTKPSTQTKAGKEEPEKDESLLQTDSVTPSSRTRTREEVLRRAAEGDHSVTREEIRKALNL